MCSSNTAQHNRTGNDLFFGLYVFFVSAVAKGESHKANV